MQILVLPELGLRLPDEPGAISSPSGSVELSPLSVRLLRYLAERRAHVVSKEELLREVWSDVRVSGASVDQALHVLRSELRGVCDSRSVIRTIRGHGYQLATDVIVRHHSDDRMPFVGREPELKAFDAAAEVVEEGAARILVLSGEAGIGKTRMIDEFAERAHRRRFRASRVRCGDARQGPPLETWGRLVRSLLGAGEIGPDHLPRRTVQVLEEVLPGIVPEPRYVSDVDARAARRRFLEAVEMLVVAAARSAPRLLAFDDLHWADASSLRLLDWLATRIAEHRILLVVAQRDGASPASESFAPTLGRLLRQPSARELRLPPLDRAEVERALGALDHDIDASRSDALWRRCGGNPFYLSVAVGEELRHERTGSLSRAAREAVLEPLGDLSAATLRVLRTASASGDEIDPGLLARLERETRDRIEAALEEASGVGFVRPGAHGGLEFTHALVQEALYESLDPGERIHLHARYTATLAEQPGVPAAAIAEHALRATGTIGPEAAAAHCARAAQEASDRLASEDAATWFERGLALIPHGLVPERLDLLIGLANARARIQGAPGAAESAEEAILLARTEQQPLALARAVLALGLARGTDNDRPDPSWIDRLEEAVSVHWEDTPERARLLSLLAHALWFSPAQERARALVRESVELADRIGDGDALAEALVRAYRILQTGRRDEAVRTETTARLALVVDRVRDRLIALEAHLTAYWDALIRGAGPDVMSAATRMEQEADAIGGPHASWWASISRTSLAHLRGDFARAEASAERGLALGQESGLVAAIPNFALQLLSIRRDQGRLAELEPMLAAPADGMPENPGWTIARRLAQRAAGITGPARELLRNLSDGGFSRLPLNVGYVPMLVMLADLAVCLPDEPAAALLLQAIQPLRDLHAVVTLGFCHWGALAGTAGRLAAVLGDHERAIRWLEEGIDRDRRLGALPCVARGELALARALTTRGRAGDAERARRLEASGHALARDLGMSVGE